MNFDKALLVMPAVKEIAGHYINRGIEILQFRFFGEKEEQVRVDLIFRDKKFAPAMISFEITDLDKPPEKAHLIVGGVGRDLVFNEDSPETPWVSEP